MITPNGGVFGRNPKFNNVTVTGTLTASGAISAAQSITMGSGANLVMASGNGISFAAHPHAAGMTSALLDDYEEGTWTPDFTTTGVDFATMTVDIVSAVYTKVGRLVTVTSYIRTDDVDIAGATGQTVISGLPFTAVSSNGWSAINVSEVSSWVKGPSSGYLVPNTTSIYVLEDGTNGNLQGHGPARFTTGAVANQNVLIFSALYYTAT